MRTGGNVKTGRWLGTTALALLALCFIVPSLSQVHAQGSPIGTNLAEIRDYEADWAFVDRMKHARKWVTSNADGSGPWSTGVDIPLRPDGYPIEIPVDPDGGGPILPQIVGTLLFRAVPYPSGDYTLVFDGQGTIEVKYDANGVFSQPGVPHRIRVASPTVNGIFLRITRSLRSDPIRNIRFLMPGFDQNYETQLFHPLFLERLKVFKVLRFMDWGQVNIEAPGTWTERITPDSYSQGTFKGVAYEYMIDLANRLNADPWFCIPHLADDDYIRRCAALIRTRLKPERKVYVEWSNEVWNDIFPQASYAKEQGLALGLSTDYVKARLFYIARRAGAVFKIFEEEFGGSSRIVKVAAGQAMNPWILSQVMTGFNDSSINPSGGRPSALSCAFYWGGTTADELIKSGQLDSATVDQILDHAADYMRNVRLPKIVEHVALAERHGLPLVAYEGGQALIVGRGFDSATVEAMTEKLIAANRHPRMKDLYKDMFRLWFQAGGGAFCSFTAIYVPRRHGMWGLLEHQDQPVSEAYKYQGVMDALGVDISDVVPPARPRTLTISS